MTLTLVWHKPCWRASGSPTGYAALGGLPRQIAALSELFDATRIVGPVVAHAEPGGATNIAGKHVTVVPLGWLSRRSWVTLLSLPWWLALNATTLVGEISRADAVLALVPSPIGLLGLVLAIAFRKRIITRQLNSWSDPRLVWRVQRAILERIAGGRTIVFATGGDREPPSRRNPAIQWMFSSTVLESELAANGTPRRLDPRRPARLIIAGREVEVEGTRLVLRALAILSNRYPDMTLDVVGNGDALVKSRQLAQEMSLTGRVTFHGPLDHARTFELLRQSDLFCLPAIETEAFRQAVHESLAAGVPLLATRGAILPMIADAGCAVCIDEKTPDALAEAIHACLADPEGYARMSAKAVQTAGAYTLERWRDTIGSAMADAWGPLQSAPATTAAAGDEARTERAEA